jgi:hypothetical protein
MQAGIQFRLQKRIHYPVPVQPAHAGKPVGNNADPHMCFTRSSYVWLMPGMLMAFVENDQPLRLEVVLQCGFYSGSDGHFRSVVKHCR